MPFDRGNLEIKYVWECCKPALVQVWSLPKRTVTTHKWENPGGGPPIDKRYVDPKTPKRTATQISAENAEPGPTLMYTGTLRCCSDLHLFPAPIAIPVETRHNPVALSKASFRMRYDRCCGMALCNFGAIRVERGECDVDVLDGIKLDMDYLTPPEQLELAAERYCKNKFSNSSQRLMGVVRDGGCGNGNCTAPHLQCCAQKTILTSTILEANGIAASERAFYDFMSPPTTALCCEYPCWYESSFCCTNKTCCHCDCCGCCGESRSMKCRCCCCGEVRHEYPMHVSDGATSSSNGRNEAVKDGGIVVYADQNFCCGNADSDLLTTLIKLPKGSSVHEAQVLAAIAIEISSSYFKIC